MADTPLRLIAGSQDRPWAEDVNVGVRLFTGRTTGGIILRGDLGTRRDHATNPNTETTGHYTLEIQSLAATGLHAAFGLSGTAVGVALTAANSAVLITDSGIALGTTAGLRFDLERLRIYETGRVDYSEATSLNGELILGGSGASAGALSTGGSITALGGSAIKMNNAANTAVGQFAADASGNVVVGGTTGTINVNGHLGFLNTANRITGDLTNATIASRVIFQTSTANSGTLVSAMPLGAGAAAGFVGYNNSTPASATGAAQLHATATAIELRADSPAASYLPMTFHTSNVEAMRIGLTGAITSPTQPRVRAYDSNATTSHATSGTWQTVLLNSERYDVGAMHSTVSNTGRLTAPVTGLYSIKACVMFAANAVGSRGLKILLNGTTTIWWEFIETNTTGQETMLHVSCDYQLTATDYVEMQGYQSSGGALNMLASANASPEFSARLVA